ncbi:MAG: Y-family DNA polymerase [Proteobacteria bacterium]|nr:Y-family DNA polymerase [Pseudomonadota bacterium]MBU1736995.1 Y-family DNA polymerase [Pseudomonadota bacterium]
MKKLFALIDCNNFYVSCERVFNPKLAGKPVVVLSNNDGCIIARSEEAKKLGIKMGEPFFKCEKTLSHHAVHVYSSNYPLYGDMSQRVMAVIGQQEPEVEMYSIDEAFVRLPRSGNITDYGRALREKIRKQTGIPVSIGIGPTKTLAKIANRIAKKRMTSGVFDLTDHPQLTKILAETPAESVWGVGRKSGAKLAAANIHSALDLMQAEDVWLRKIMTVTGLRTAMELRGISCLDLDETSPKKSITCSRSFGHPVQSLEDLREAVATYTAIAAAKLRQQQSVASCLQVYINTDPFSKDQACYFGHRTTLLTGQTANTGELTRAAIRCLKTIYRPGHRYKKAGILLSGLTSDACRQPGLFTPAADQQPELMAAIDRVNRHMGHYTLQYGVAGFRKDWRNRQDRRSPAYTTCWQQLVMVKA